MSAQYVFRRAAEAYAGRPEDAEWRNLMLAAVDLHREFRAQKADCRAASAPPAAEEPPARVSEPASAPYGWGSKRWDIAAVVGHAPSDPTGTDPYPPQLKPPRTDPELLALLERARNHVMTDEEIAAQRASFVRGQLGMGNDADEAAYRESLKPPRLSEEGTW